MADCRACAGACCEDFVFPKDGLSKATQELLEVRCTVVTLVPGAAGYVLDNRCPELTADGRCGIYDSRPMICALYAAGGPACIETVRRRRPTRVKEILG